MITDDIASARTAISSLQGGDEREKYAAAHLDLAEQLLAEARDVSRDTVGAGSEAVGRARSLVDLAVLVVSDPPKVAPAPKRAARGRKK